MIALAGDIRRQVLFGIAVALRAVDPDLFGSKPLAQFPEYADIISNPINERYPVLFALYDDCPSEFRDDVIVGMVSSEG